ncbi:hypothetical protein D3C75_1193640 [compost metagenome]
MYAREILQSMDLTGLNPNDMQMWQERISADVLNSRNGITDQLAEGANNRLGIA